MASFYMSRLENTLSMQVSALKWAKTKLLKRIQAYKSSFHENGKL